MIGQRTKRKVPSQWKDTKVAELKVNWKQDPLSLPGVGTLSAHITVTKKVYRFAHVPKRLYRDMLHVVDPERLLNQILAMYQQEDLCQF